MAKAGGGSELAVPQGAEAVAVRFLAACSRVLPACFLWRHLAVGCVALRVQQRLARRMRALHVLQLFRQLLRLLCDALDVLLQVVVVCVQDLGLRGLHTALGGRRVTRRGIVRWCVLLAVAQWGLLEARADVAVIVGTLGVRESGLLWAQNLAGLLRLRHVWATLVRHVPVNSILALVRRFFSFLVSLDDCLVKGMRIYNSLTVASCVLVRAAFLVVCPAARLA